jgi:hypothetical protein
MASGPRPGELTLAVLTGLVTTAGDWPPIAVERVGARTGSVLATDYLVGSGYGVKSSPRVHLSADPSGQHLLLTIGVPGGFVTGPIGDGKMRLLPLGRQPYSGFSIIAW